MADESGITPQALLDRPVLYGTAAEIAQAYNVLAMRRTSGMSPNPISLSEILSFIKIFGPPTIPVNSFVELIGVVDVEYLGLISGNLDSS